MDFREEQCQQYDQMEFNETRYAWEPYYDGKIYILFYLYSIHHLILLIDFFKNT